MAKASTPAVKKSFTLSSRVVQRLEERSRGNMSQAVEELLETALDREEEVQRIHELAAMMGTEVDPEIEARAMEYLLEIAAKGSAAGSSH